MNYYFKGLRNYANFNTRATRSEFWYFFLSHFFILILIIAISILLGLPSLISIYNFFIIIPSLSIGVRRMHDVGKSGWFILIPIYSLFLCFLSSQKGRNKYGKNPNTPSTLAKKNMQHKKDEKEANNSYELKKLNELYAEGVIGLEDFNEQKNNILKKQLS